MYEKAVISTRKMDAIVLGVVVVVFILLTVVLFGGGLARGRTQLARHTELMRERASLNEVQSALMSGRDLLTVLREKQTSLQEIVPSEARFQDFYNAISESAATHSLILAEVQPAPSVPRPDFLVLPVSINAAGSFENFHAFLFDVLSLPRAAQIDRLSIFDADGEGLCTVQLTLSIFSEKKEAEHAG